MRWSSRRSLVVCIGLVIVVAAAYAAGRAHFYELISLVALAAVALSVAAIIRPQPAERVSGIMLLVWIVLATLSEQFAWAASNDGVLVAAVWLVFPIAGGVALPAAGNWLSGLGCWAASFAGVAATTYSVPSVTSGAGLFMRWLS